MGTDFLRLVKSLSGTLTLIISDKLTVKTYRGEYSLVLENYEEMPSQDIKNSEVLFDIDANELSGALNICSLFVSKDDLRPIFEAIHINLEDKEMVATDAHVLILMRPDFKDIKDPQPINISTITQKTLSTLTDNISVKKSNNFLIFDNGKNKVVQRNIEGKYPDYKSVIPQDNNIHVRVKKNVIVEALKRLNNVSNPISRLVILDIKDSLISMYSEDIDFGKEGRETIPAEVEGGDIKIGFNINKLLNVLSNRYSNDLTLKFSTPQRAMICEGDDDILTLVMPLNINETL